VVKRDVADSREAHEFSDTEIVEGVRAGRTELFEVLMRRYNQRVYRLARAVLGTDSEAEDLAQEAWARAWSHLSQWEGRASFSTWLCRIALHEGWARRRRDRRMEPLEAAAERGDHAKGGDRDMMEPASPGEGAEGSLYGTEIRSLLEGAVGSLPETYRTVFVLRQLEELSTAETAECLEISEEAVKVRLHRARGALQRELLERAGPGIRQAFPFLGARCDRMVAAVMARIGAARSVLPEASARPD
jgi:RNA polymerase sigma-70 factor (ECF subfamily)